MNCLKFSYNYKKSTLPEEFSWFQMCTKIKCPRKWYEKFKFIADNNTHYDGWKCTRFHLLTLLNETPNIIHDKINTHSIEGMAFFAKNIIWVFIKVNLYDDWNYMIINMAFHGGWMGPSNLRSLAFIHLFFNQPIYLIHRLAVIGTTNNYLVDSYSSLITISSCCILTLKTQRVQSYTNKLTGLWGPVSCLVLCLWRMA